MSGLDLERAIISQIMLGICERALELTIGHAKTREQFGQPIAGFQMIQAKLADMFVWIETMRSFTYQVLAECTAIAHGEGGRGRSEEHTSELQSLMRISYAVFCLKKKTKHTRLHT